MPQCKLNRNDGYFQAGIKSQELLSPADSTAFLKSLVEDFNPRCRTSDDFKRLALEYLARWKSACDYFAELKYVFDDFVQERRCREAYFDKAMSRPFASATEHRQWAKRFVDNFIRQDNQAASPAQKYRRLIHWNDNDLTADAALRLLDASGLVGEWTYQTYEQADMTFTDLTPLSEGAILKCPTVHMHITKRLVPWIFESGRLYRDTSNGHIACHSLILPFLHPQLSCRYEPIALNGDYLDWRPQNIVLGSSSKPMFRSQIDFNKKLVGLEPWMHEKVSRDPMNARPTAVPINPDKKIDRDDLARYKFRKGAK